MAMINCPECEKEISDKAESCIHCGFPIKQYLKKINDEKGYCCPSCHKQNELGRNFCKFCGFKISQKEFHGIYKYTVFGKQEVYCPRCGSEDCSHYKEQNVIPAKTKTRYTANLNPLHPFTLVNKKEKVKRKEKVVTEAKIICNSCGKIFK